MNVAAESVGSGTFGRAEEARDLAIAERDEAYRQRDEAKADLGTVRLRTLASIVGLSELATWDDLAALLRGLAGAEPPQTFRPPISVIVRHACDHPFAEVTIGAIQDPAFLALPMGVRLGLVVIRD